MRWYPGSRADPALSFSGLSRAACIDTRFRMCLRREGAAHVGARVSSASRRERRSIASAGHVSSDVHRLLQAFRDTNNTVTKI